MSNKGAAHDPETLAFYDREAKNYAVRPKPERNKRLEQFLTSLAPGAKILELGCGGGQDSEAMIRAGFDVTPTDGSPGLAREAERRLGQPVKILRFEDLDERAAFDAVWASACLLHVPADRLADVLTNVHAALRGGGRFYASYKMGDGGDRDSLGRYYNFPSREKLAAAYKQAGDWATVTMEEAAGGGYDGVPRTFLHVTAVKA
ncbi:class I SAM-dependent methyltransferase [Bradyrhizobium sp. LHD-71]|uniref:class I SAM-dependent methyltransferase n=1 Tax=Bradyrhizobium sp. LHD-71 TaxID=3072141 RepID=UPI0028101F99|nr:class I SAM-dependent methyltransferase [Bradyrhizobium sp. LHD-71]MDQ8726569.1 class I SAM-dependent methyltransferase [Bradyrhizobium sp. LHD-71]